MHIIRSEHIWCFDVDDTLVLWDKKHKGTVKMMCPHLNIFMKLAPHYNNIRLLKEKHHRGSTIIVWSQGGYEYAAAVIKALGLEKYVDYVLSKPIGVVDDLPVDAWMPKSFTLDPDKKYKE